MENKATYYGCPYPIRKNINGIMSKISGLDVLKSDLIALLLTNPGERIMLPEYGTGLRNLLFENNDNVLVNKIRQLIVDTINTEEPRVVIKNLDVSTNYNSNISNDIEYEDQHVLNIKIDFIDPQNIIQTENLVLNLPLEN